MVLHRSRVCKRTANQVKEKPSLKTFVEMVVAQDALWANYRNRRKYLFPRNWGSKSPPLIICKICCGDDLSGVYDKDESIVHL